MNPGYLMFLLLFLPLFGIGQADWELRKENEGIKVYTKDIKGSDFSAYRGVTTLGQPLSVIIAAIRDISSYPEWMPNASSTRILEERGDSSIIYYLTTDAPWPVKDRDGIYQMIFRREGAQKIRIELEDRPEYLPRKKDYVRIPKTKGFWLLAPLSGQRVEVVYQISVDPGGSVPAWLANPMSVSQPYKTLRALSERVQLKKYKGKEYSFMP